MEPTDFEERLQGIVDELVDLFDVDEDTVLVAISSLSDSKDDAADSAPAKPAKAPRPAVDPAKVELARRLCYTLSRKLSAAQGKDNVLSAGEEAMTVSLTAIGVSAAKQRQILTLMRKGKTAAEAARIAAAQQ